jgi:hypothetical protein
LRRYNTTILLKKENVKMSNYYNLDGIKTELNKRIARAEALLEAWKKVTFPTKKNGEPFANMSKNINGANYISDQYALQSGVNKLCLSTWTTFDGWETDELDCYVLVKYLKDEKKIAKTDNYMPKQSYLEQVYKYDIDDIKEAVSNRINYLKDRITTLKAQFDIVEDCYRAFRECYSKAIEELVCNCESAGSVGYSDGKNDIYYMILDTIKERFPYC